MSAAAATQVAVLCDAVAAMQDLRPEALMPRIEKAVGAQLSDLGATPGEALSALLAGIGEQSLQPLAQEDPGNWARQAVTRVRDWASSLSPPTTR